MKLVLGALIFFGFALENYPEYKKDIERAVNQLEAGIDLTKSRINLNRVLNQKKAAIRNYEKTQKGKLREKHKKLEADLKTQHKNEYQKANDKKAIYEKHKKERQELLDANRKEEQALKAELKKNKQEFDTFMRTEKRKFDQKHNALKRARSAQIRKELNKKNPVLEEFKEIPKGPGIQLKPGE